MAPDELTGTTESESTGAVPEVVKDEAGRTIIKDKFSFKIPETHPDCDKDTDGLGKGKKGGTYIFSQCANDQQAAATLLERKWRLMDLVNDELKSRARSNAYQNATMPYKPSEVPQETIRTRMIRDLIRSGVSEALATTTIDTVLASK